MRVSKDEVAHVPGAMQCGGIASQNRDLTKLGVWNGP